MTRSQLRELIKETVQARMQEMARIASRYSIGNLENLEKVEAQWQNSSKTQMIIKYLQKHPNSTIEDIANFYGYSQVAHINPPFGKLLAAGVITRGETVVPKKEKPPTSGIKGRPKSAKAIAAEEIYNGYKTDPNFQPSPEQVALFEPEELEQIKGRALGTLKRGRSISPDIQARLASLSDDDLES